jgi:hypothetical protein
MRTRGSGPARCGLRRQQDSAEYGDERDDPGVGLTEVKAAGPQVVGNGCEPRDQEAQTPQTGD